MTEFRKAGKLPPRKPRITKKYLKENIDQILNKLEKKYGAEYIEMLLEIIANPKSKLVSDWAEKILSSGAKTAFNEFVFAVLRWFLELYSLLK